MLLELAFEAHDSSAKMPRGLLCLVGARHVGGCLHKLVVASVGMPSLREKVGGERVGERHLLGEFARRVRARRFLDLITSARAREFVVWTEDLTPQLPSEQS